MNCPLFEIVDALLRRGAIPDLLDKSGKISASASALSRRDRTADPGKLF